MERNDPSYTRTFETEVGTIVLHWKGDDLQVQVNYDLISIPNAWKKQTSTTIISKVCKLIKEKA